MGHPRHLRDVNMRQQLCFYALRQLCRNKSISSLKVVEYLKKQPLKDGKNNVKVGDGSVKKIDTKKIDYDADGLVIDDTVGRQSLNAVKIRARRSTAHK